MGPSKANDGKMGFVEMGGKRRVLGTGSTGQRKKIKVQCDKY